MYSLDSSNRDMFFMYVLIFAVIYLSTFFTIFQCCMDSCDLHPGGSRLLKFLFLVEIFNSKMWLASPGDFIPAQLKRKYYKYCFKAPDKMFIFQIWTSDMNTELEGGRRRSWLKVWQYGTKAKLTQEDTNSNNIMGCIPSSEEAPEVWILDNFTFCILQFLTRPVWRKI